MEGSFDGGMRICGSVKRPDASGGWFLDQLPSTQGRNRLLQPAVPEGLLQALQPSGAFAGQFIACVAEIRPTISPGLVCRHSPQHLVQLQPQVPVQELRQDVLLLQSLEEHVE